MSENNSNPNSEWVRLDVGGKVFKTTKSTLSNRPESFLARLVNGDLPSETDESGAFLIDRDPEHFRTVLNYLRSGVLNMERNEKQMKELLCEADFYNIQPLVDEIRNAMKPVISRTETVIVSRIDKSKISAGGQQYTCRGTIVMSDPRDDNEVLKALRRSCSLVAKHGTYYINTKKDSTQIWSNIELTLREFGFQQHEFYVKTHGDSSDESEGGINQRWKYIRTIQE